MEAGIIDNRIIGAAAVVIIVCVVAVYMGIQYAPRPAATYKISGYVKTDTTAVPSVTVTLDGKSTVTDSNGYYEFTGLEGNKTYTLAVSKSGYESHSESVQLGAEDKQVSDIILKAVEMPLTAITSALASQEGVPTENVSLYFCDQAAPTDNFAVGAVISQRTSIVFIYTQSTSAITEDNRYTPITSDEIQGMSTLSSKVVLSRFTGNRIVPFGLVKTDGAYHFEYYDGWKGIYQPGWGRGNGTMAENGEVTLYTHAWIS